MATEITVTSLGPAGFDVQVAEGGSTTSHRVDVPAAFRAQLLTGALSDIELETVIQETFLFLLERESASAIMREFSLDIVGRFFPEYVEELRARLAAKVTQ